MSLYPLFPGHTDNRTSLAAAVATKPKARTLRRLALDVLQSSPGGMTADEVADACGVSVLAMRPRVTELGRMGLIEKSYRRRRNASGMSAAVWIVSSK